MLCYDVWFRRTNLTALSYVWIFGCCSHDVSFGLLAKVVPSAGVLRTKRDAVDEEAASRMQRILNRNYQTNKDNCRLKKAYELFLPGDVNFGTVQYLWCNFHHHQYYYPVIFVLAPLCCFCLPSVMLLDCL